MVVPADIPVNTPVDEFIVATPVEPLDHTPPVVASVNVVADPIHTAEAPLIAATTGKAFTVTNAVCEHPLLLV